LARQLPLLLLPTTTADNGDWHIKANFTTERTPRALFPFASMSA